MEPELIRPVLMRWDALPAPSTPRLVTNFVWIGLIKRAPTGKFHRGADNRPASDHQLQVLDTRHLIYSGDLAGLLCYVGRESEFHRSSIRGLSNAMGVLDTYENLFLHCRFRRKVPAGGDVPQTRSSSFRTGAAGIPLIDRDQRWRGRLCFLSILLSARQSLHASLDDRWHLSLRHRSPCRQRPLGRRAVSTDHR